MAMLLTLLVLAVPLLLVLTVLLSLGWVVLAVWASVGWVGTRLLRLTRARGREV
jgi:hypothetical protein